MGFFSDLKDDLSQAVNELMPDEEAEGAQNTQDADTLSLDEMLKNIDSIQLPDDTETELSAEELQRQDASGQTSTEAEPELSQEEQHFSVENAVTGLEDGSSEEAKSDDWNLESMLENALTEEAIQRVEKTEAYKGAGETMDMSTSRVAADETSIITAGMSINGDIVSEGSLDIVGKVTGNIDVLGKLNITGHISGNSKAAEVYADGAKITGEVVSEGAVKIGASTVIVGNITALSAAIAGAVKGDIDVRGPVILDASAIVMGNIKSKSVQINNGAVIEGMCSQCYADVSPTSFFEDYKMEMKKDKK